MCANWMLLCLGRDPSMLLVNPESKPVRRLKDQTQLGDAQGTFIYGLEIEVTCFISASVKNGSTLKMCRTRLKLIKHLQFRKLKHGINVFQPRHFFGVVFDGKSRRRYGVERAHNGCWKDPRRYRHRPFCFQNRGKHSSKSTYCFNVCGIRMNLGHIDA